MRNAQGRARARTQALAHLRGGACAEGLQYHISHALRRLHVKFTALMFDDASAAAMAVAWVAQPRTFSNERRILLPRVPVQMWQR
jgi:hypothetical protein